MIGVFVSSLAFFLYVLSSAWVAGGEAIVAGIPLVYLTGGITTLSFFSYRMLDYHKRYENTSLLQRLSISFFDLVTYFCVISLAVWGFIFPVLKPIPQDFQLQLLYQNTLTLNLYVGLIFCAGIIIFRIALQPLIAKSNTIMIITSPQKIAPKDPIIATDSRNFDNRTFDMLSSIDKEISKIREQISSLNRDGEVPIAPRPMATTKIENHTPSTGVVSVTETESRARQSSTSPVQVYVGPIAPNLDKVPSNGSAITNTAFQIPDSAKDNPWASVLSSRQQRHKPSQKIQPSTSVNAPSVSVSSLNPTKSSVASARVHDEDDGFF